MSTQSPQAAPSPERFRFVRLNPRFDRDETLQLLNSEIQSHQSNVEGGTNGHHARPVPWLNSKERQLEFFAIPSGFCLHKSAAFQSGRVYGMDVTSGAAVAALLFELFDVVTATSSSEADGIPQIQSVQSAPLRVLDLCCAPGLKLCMMADLVAPSSTVVGVDISSQRISLCKNIIKKYHIDETSSPSKSNGQPSKDGGACHGTTIRLFCADGTTFGMHSSSTNGLVFDSSAAMEEFQSRGKRKRMNKSARAREKRRLLELQRKEENTKPNDAIIQTNGADSKHKGQSIVDPAAVAEAHENASDKATGEALSGTLFDRVLVDAECSTDGAIRHIEKRLSSAASSKSPAWDETNMDELVDLQKRLIDSGFRLLKRGGVLVYSTCSLSSKQNEQVVRWLFDKCTDAFIIPVSFLGGDGSPANLGFIEEGSLPGTVRFNPLKERVHHGNACVDCMLPGSGFFLAKIGKRVHDER